MDTKTMRIVKRLLDRVQGDGAKYATLVNVEDGLTIQLYDAAGQWIGAAHPNSVDSSTLQDIASGKHAPPQCEVLK